MQQAGTLPTYEKFLMRKVFHVFFQVYLDRGEVDHVVS
jgi:hypothetical protein